MDHEMRPFLQREEGSFARGDDDDARASQIFREIFRGCRRAALRNKTIKPTRRRAVRGVKIHTSV
jgi:hypothetical protein